MTISKNLMAREIALEQTSRQAATSTQEQYEVWTGPLPNGKRSPGFEIDLKENLVAYCVRRSVLMQYDIKNRLSQGESKLLTASAPPISSNETIVEILKRELIRVYITVGRSKNIKDKPRPQDYWVAIDYNDRGIWYGHLVPRADTLQEGKFGVPVGQGTRSSVVPASNAVRGDMGGDPSGSFGLTSEQKKERLNDLLAEVRAGSKMYGNGMAVPSDTATIITSNDGTSSTALRVESGTVYADEAGKATTYDPKESQSPNRFNDCPTCRLTKQTGNTPTSPIVKALKGD